MYISLNFILVYTEYINKVNKLGVHRNYLYLCIRVNKKSANN